MIIILWRKKDCVGVDIEASALVSVCNYHNMKSSVLLLASDKHHKSEDEKQWAWGKGDFKIHKEISLSLVLIFLVI